jgi:uncharacterized protein (DUF58 family)
LRSKRRSLGKRWKLQTDKAFIFPTGFGFAFGILTFILLVMAIGYGNNLLYFFVFLLVSMGLTGAWQTNKNIECARITGIETEFLFANEPNSITLHLQNTYDKSPLWDIEVPADLKRQEQTGFKTVDEVQVARNVDVHWTPSQRGRAQLPRLRIQSRFPYKMLRAWKYFEKADAILVYPQRKGSQNFRSLLGSQAQKDLESKPETEGLFRDYREFQRTDSPSRIDWKRSLKHQKHLVKNYESAGERKILIDFDMTQASLSFEDRLSQMALWVDLCHNKKEIYSIKLGGYQSEFSSTLLHYKACLEKLALITKEEVA